MRTTPYYHVMCDDCDGKVYRRPVPHWWLRIAARWHTVRTGHRDVYGHWAHGGLTP